MNPDIDTREGITEYLKDLGTFNELIAARHKAGYDDDRQLQSWVVLGRYDLDTCGNTMVITEGAPADVHRFTCNDYRALKNVMTKEEAFLVTKSWTSTVARIPKVMDRCPRCGQGWTLRNAHDVYGPYERPIMHKQCRALEVVQRDWEQLTKIADTVGIAGERIMVPGEYFPDPLYFGPWMVIDTPKGPLKFGWRKRVINISWEGSKFEIPPQVFENEDVTKSSDMIHAWSEAKAIEYLTKIWERR